MSQRFKSFFYAFLMATVVALFVRLVVVEDYRISSNSMMPNLLAGDLVFVFKPAFNVHFPFSSYELIKIRRPNLGDVVALSLPDRGQETFVKRIVALEGDRIELKDGVFYRNGHQATYRPLDPKTPELSTEVIDPNLSYVIQKGKSQPSDYGPVDIPKDHFFALGDNRDNSVDSRVWGPLPYSCLKGRVKLIWLSLDEGGQIRPNRIGLWIK
jgi:signal peptidase I